MGLALVLRCQGRGFAPWGPGARIPDVPEPSPWGVQVSALRRGDSGHLWALPPGPSSLTVYSRPGGFSGTRPGVLASLEPGTWNEPCPVAARGSRPPGEQPSQGPAFPADPGSWLSLVTLPVPQTSLAAALSWGLSLLSDRTQSLTRLGVPVLLGDLYWFGTLLRDPSQDRTLLSDLPQGPALSGPCLVDTRVRASPAARPGVRYPLVPPR